MKEDMVTFKLLYPGRHHFWAVCLTIFHWRTVQLNIFHWAAKFDDFLITFIGPLFSRDVRFRSSCFGLASDDCLCVRCGLGISLLSWILGCSLGTLIKSSRTRWHQEHMAPRQDGPKTRWCCENHGVGGRMIALQAKSDELQNTSHELLLGPHQDMKCMWKQCPENRHTVF